MKIFKNKLILGLISIIVLGVMVFGYIKIREHDILKDVFVFKNEDIVSIWRLKKGEANYDYEYELENNECKALSDILTNSKLEKANINDFPSNDLGLLTILLDGQTKEMDGGISYQFERGITLVPIDKHSVYVFLEINEPIHDDSFNMNRIMEKSYIINSEKLVELISENTQ